jgi:CheY-like chemotaxis protein
MSPRLLRLGTNRHRQICRLQSGRQLSGVSGITDYQLPIFIMARRQDKTVLCVDDDQAALSGWCLYLQSKGYSVVGAASGEEGLQRFAVQPIDAVILDYTMPELNGSAVSEMMKRIKPKVPIILFTGSVGVPDHIHKTVDDQILKGGEPSELLEKVDSILGISESGKLSAKA